MNGNMRHMARKARSIPGTAAVTSHREHPVTVQVLRYSEDGCSEETITDSRELLPHTGQSLCWIDVSGVHDLHMINRLGEILGLHPLVIEDIANVGQRPKVEDYDTYLFFSLRAVRLLPRRGDYHLEQVSLLAGENYVVTFREQEPDLFADLKNRIRTGKGKIRSSGTDYLVYAILDVLVDDYFLVLEQMGERIEQLEEEVVAGARPRTLSAIHRIKNELLFMRKAVWPLREVIGSLAKNENRVFHDTTIVYLRDLYDHCVQIIDTVEMYRDMASGLIDIYLSNISYKLNEIMKVLAIISTVFLPLNFITGYFGMNIKEMPELDWIWMQPAVIAVMAFISWGLLLAFRRKHWL